MMVLKVTKARLVLKVTKVLKDLLVQKALKDLWVVKETKEHKDHKVLLVKVVMDIQAAPKVI
jgi:hypothetical protein